MSRFKLNSVFIALALGVFIVSPAAAAPKAATNTAEYQILATTMGGLQGMQAPLTLELDARGAPAPAGTQQAQHAIPPGMKMGKELPLLRPEQHSAPTGGVPGSQESWTLKIYWGCSKEVQKGQPIIISPQEMKSGKGQFANLAGGKGVWKGAPPAGWGWGQWPNRQSSIPVPGGASLKGDHLVTGNYLPEIKFNIAQHDFLPPLSVKTAGDPKTSIGISWQPVRGAVGYFAYAMAANQAKKETIIWTSSSKASMGIMTHEHSAHVKELVRCGVVLGPDKTDCNIPAGIFADAEGAMVMMFAWGEDYWMSYPPKPNNAPKDWKPDWTVNALFMSRWMGMPGMPDMEEMMRGAAPEYEEEKEESPPARGGKNNRSRPGISLPLPGLKF
jgi:hypothetical protein